MKIHSNCTSLALAAICAISSQSVAAQVDEPNQVETENVGDPIIVDGYSARQVRQFLWRSLVGDAAIKRVQPICFGIDNAPRVLSEPLENRIAENLAEFQVELAEPDCDVNTVVVFYENAHSFVNWLSDNHRHVFDALYNPERRRLIRPVRQAYSWHYIPNEASRGRSFDSFQSVGGRLQAFSAATFNGLAAPTPATASSHSFTVIDTDAIDGLTVEQLGDYITMQILTEWRPRIADEVPRDSILRLFDDNGPNPDAAPGLSRLDRIVLTEIYSPDRAQFRAPAIRVAIARAAIDTLDDDGFLLASARD